MTQKNLVIVDDRASAELIAAIASKKLGYKAITMTPQQGMEAPLGVKLPESIDILVTSVPLSELPSLELRRRTDNYSIIVTGSRDPENAALTGKICYVQKGLDYVQRMSDAISRALLN